MSGAIIGFTTALYSLKADISIKKEQIIELNKTLNTLKQQSQNIISLYDALKGEAGQAIRAFYTECHIPFLQFFQVVIEEYSSALKKTKQALHALESNQHGFISQTFIEHELDQGLKKRSERFLTSYQM